MANLTISVSLVKCFPTGSTTQWNENLVRKAICGLIIRFQILSVRLTEEVLFAKFIEAELLLATLFQLNDELLEHSLHLLLDALLLSDQRLLFDGSACLGGLLLIIVVAILLLFVIISLHFLFLYFFLSHTILSITNYLLLFDQPILVCLSV